MGATQSVSCLIGCVMNKLSPSEFLKTHIAIAIDEANKAPRSREMSLVITKLEEAAMWNEKVSE